MSWSLHSFFPMYEEVSPDLMKDLRQRKLSSPMVSLCSSHGLYTPIDASNATQSSLQLKYYHLRASQFTIYLCRRDLLVHSHIDDLNSSKRGRCGEDLDSSSRGKCCDAVFSQILDIRRSCYRTLRCKDTDLIENKKVNPMTIPNRILMSDT